MEFRTLRPSVLAVFLVWGCTQSPPPAPAVSDGPAPSEGTNGTGVDATPEPASNGSPAAMQPEPDVAPTVVELQLLEWEGVEELIASHKGRVVVVDLWATYCAPCIREFPGLVALSQSHPEDVACISVSLDDVDDQEAALTFLREQNALIDNVLCTTDPDTLYDEILKVGAIPVIYVYGPDGELRQRFTSPTDDGGEVTYEGHIVPFVEELLGEG